MGGFSKKTPVVCVLRNAASSSAASRCSAMSTMRHASASRRLAQTMCSDPSPVKTGGSCVRSSSRGSLSTTERATSSDSSVLHTIKAWRAYAPTESGTSKSSGALAAISSRTRRMRSSAGPEYEPGYAYKLSEPGGTVTTRWPAGWVDTRDGPVSGSLHSSVCCPLLTSLMLTGGVRKSTSI